LTVDDGFPFWAIPGEWRRVSKGVRIGLTVWADGGIQAMRNSGDVVLALRRCGRSESGDGLHGVGSGRGSGVIEAFDLLLLARNESEQRAG